MKKRTPKERIILMLENAEMWRSRAYNLVQENDLLTDDVDAAFGDASIALQEIEGALDKIDE